MRLKRIRNFPLELHIIKRKPNRGVAPHQLSGTDLGSAGSRNIQEKQASLEWLLFEKERVSARHKDRELFPSRERARSVQTSTTRRR